jgi:hypothetical protein
MSRQNIGYILGKIDRREGLPRIEIEGAGRKSSKDDFLGLFPPRRTEQRAIYVIKDEYNEGPFSTEYDTEWVYFPKSALESVVTLALESESKVAQIACEGKYEIHKEKWVDLGGPRSLSRRQEHMGGPLQSSDVLVELALEIMDDPRITVSYKKRTY